jgi:hypothetical protein
MEHGTNETRFLCAVPAESAQKSPNTDSDDEAQGLFMLAIQLLGAVPFKPLLYPLAT